MGAAIAQRRRALPRPRRLPLGDRGRVWCGNSPIHSLFFFWFHSRLYTFFFPVHTQVLIGTTCSPASIAFLAATNSSRMPFFPFVAAQASHSSSALFPLSPRTDAYAADKVHGIAESLAALFYYFDWSVVFLIAGDDATSAQLQSAIRARLFTPSQPVTNQTLVNAYAAARAKSAATCVKCHPIIANSHVSRALSGALLFSFDSCAARSSVSFSYATIHGPQAGSWDGTLPLLMNVPPATRLPADYAQNASQLDAALSALINEADAATANVFVFLCPVDLAARASASLLAAGNSGQGYIHIVMPHLAVPLLQSSAESARFFSGSLGVRSSTFAGSAFAGAYQIEFGTPPLTYAALAHDCVTLTAAAVAAARAQCADPANATAFAVFARGVSFAGATGDVAFSPLTNDRVAAAALSSSRPNFQLFNAAGSRWIWAGNFFAHRLHLPSTSDLVFPGSVAHATRQYRVAVLYSSSSVPDSANAQQAALAAISTAFKASISPLLTASATDALTLLPAFVVDCDSPHASTALSFILTARTPVAFIGTPTDACTAAVMQLQKQLVVTVPLIAYNDGFNQRSHTALPHFLPIEPALENNVRFLAHVLRFFGQQRVAVAYADDRQSASASDALASYNALAAMQNAAPLFGISIVHAQRMTVAPTAADFAPLLAQARADSLSTIILLLPRTSNYAAFAQAARNAGFTGNRVLVVALARDASFLDSMSALDAATAREWLLATPSAMPRQDAYQTMLSTLGAPPFNLTRVPDALLYAYDATLVCNQIAYQAQLNASLRMTSAEAFVEAARAANLVSNEDHHLVTGFASGPIVFASNENARIGGTASSMAWMQLQSGGRLLLGTSVNNYEFAPLANATALVNLSAVSCIAPGWYDHDMMMVLIADS